MDKWFTPGSDHSKLNVGDLRSMALKAYGIPEIKDSSAGLILSGYDEKNDDPPKPPSPSPANIPNHDSAHDPDKNDHFHTPGPGRHGDGRVHVRGSANGKTPGTRGGLDGVNNGGDAYNQYDNKTLIKMLNAALKRPEDHIMNDRIQNILSQLSSNKKIGRVDTETEAEEEPGDEDATRFKFTDRADLLNQLEDRIIGQDEALKRVVRPIMMRRAGIRDHDRPIAGLLLAGPSGVGKTETALALADVVYGSEDSLIRIDCSSMKNGEMSVSSLLGSGNGYVGSNQGGRLTNWVRDHKAGVIVFDEIEKASPEIWDAVLLPMLDYGKITDASKGTRDCSNCIIILTSNIGTGGIGKNGMRSVGFGGLESSVDDEMKILESDVRNAVGKTFRPELVGRLTDVIVYRPLSNEDYAKIFMVQWVNRAEQLNGLNVHVDIDDTVPRWFASHCREDDHGVRVLGKMINDKIIDPLTDMIVGTEEPLDVTVSISPDGDVSIEDNPDF
jgi:ATP-dependent Clp protease ATP-binding subunit ClpA